MKEPKDYIIFPLDVPTFKEAKKLILLLANDIGIFKVGLELFISAGPEIVKYIHEAGTAKVFLDLKLHDIPATVERAASIVGGLGVKFATVHCGDSMAMLEGAVRGSEGKTGILGVTVLTSTGREDIENAGYKEEYYTDLSSLVAQDAEGRPFEATGEGLTARVWQHENDHIDGRLILDGMSPTDEIANRRAVKQLKEKYTAAPKK